MTPVAAAPAYQRFKKTFFQNLGGALHVISGFHKGYPLEHRVYNILAFSVIVMSFLAAFLNLFFGIHWATTALGFGGCVIATGLFYVSRHRGYFTQYSIYIMMLAGFFIFASIYPFDGGSQGPWIFVVLMLVVVFVMISPNNAQPVVVIVWLAYILSLYIYELVNEDWVMTYASREHRMIDMIITFAYTFLLMSITIIAFKRSYNRERETVRQQNEELSKKNQQIETLMKELSHRVKNNLQVVSSLLNLQSARIKDPDARSAVLDGRSRLISMALIHQKLYQNERPTEVRIKDYLIDLANNIVATIRSDHKDNLLSLDIEDVVFRVEHAVPIGLIANELVTNAVKHAFDAERGDDRIWMRLYSTGMRYGLIISDNGKGISKPTADSFGLQLVQSLVEQLEGTIEFDRFKDGSSIKLEFSLTNE